MKLLNIYKTLINEKRNYLITDTDTIWMWISPDDDIIKVPKLRHRDYIMKKYDEKDYGWDYDRVFNQALKDGWVRGTYEYFPDRFLGYLSLNGYDKKRVVKLLKYVFDDLIKYGNKTIYIDYQHPQEESLGFSTSDLEGKRKLNMFLNNI